MALSTLTSDFENLRVQYDQAVASLANARLGDRIEVTDRGQRISVIEPAVPPSYRAEPNRKLLTVTGFGVGVLLSAALIFVLELVNRTIRRPTELVRALGITPFGTVPYLISQTERRRNRAQFGWSVVAFVIIGPLLLLAVLGYIMPLDAIFDRLADILGLASGAEPQSPRNSG
jgi:polysaccharide biosynthesis transport protein